MVLVCVDTLGPPGCACAQASQALRLEGRGVGEAQRLNRWRDPHNFSACQAVQGTIYAVHCSPHAVDAPQRKRWARATSRSRSRRSRMSSASSYNSANLSGNQKVRTPHASTRRRPRNLTHCSIFYTARQPKSGAPRSWKPTSRSSARTSARGSWMRCSTETASRNAN